MAADQQLADALRRDDEREDEGMDPAERETCHRCESWADHAHDWLTGRRVSVAEYEAHRRALLGHTIDTLDSGSKVAPDTAQEA